jgi:hypothetical protein
MLTPQEREESRRFPSRPPSVHTSHSHLPFTPLPSQEREESQRFPGMDSAYELHLVDVYVMGLPLEPFTTSDFTDGARVGTLHWEWHDAQSTAAPPGAMPYTPPT